MKLINKLVFAAIMLVTCTAVTTQQLQQTEKIIETEQSTIAVVRDKIDKSITGDKLVFGSVVHLKKQVGVDNIRIIQRKGAYNCARGEFIIKEVTAFDKSGNEVKDENIKTDVIMTPNIDTVKREFKFMCADPTPAPVVEPPAPPPQIITVPIPVIIEAVEEAPKKARPKPAVKKPEPAPKPIAKAPEAPKVKAPVVQKQPLNAGQRTDLVD